MEKEVAATSMPINPATAFPRSPTVDEYPYQTFTQGHSGALPQQQSFPVQYVGTVPQRQESFPGQQGVATPGMNAAQVAQTHRTNSQYKTAAPIAALGRSPAPVDCPSCGQRGLTATSFSVGNTTHGWAAVLCFLLCLGCIPYLMNDAKDVEHKCGQCGVTLATWHRSGTTEIRFQG
ncbi:lipopolysaccharide-induced transcription factor regulating tumor necrosis factor [Fusarium mundagurra]|uniref:Lipopolysaccharide-induced transcription factor regulating tumor necrosis factor n=1 Tax=Fusarium mundagurra TaxID=1567541 RepID=A0A8H5Y1X5_9HYPO|nr:lipopolysaccharide-induced transcription factor regulating tumor necrosis factor [Fusarium mundagurra]